MSTQPDRRLFRTFLSHAHANKEIVDQLHNWMARIAEMPIWYDSYNLPPTVKIASGLPRAISQCRSMMIVLSRASIQSGWVEDEYGAAINQRNQDKQFRILPVLIEECEIPGFLPNTKYIDMVEGGLNFRNASGIIFPEIEMARSLGLPCLVVSELAVNLPENLTDLAIRISVDEIKAGGTGNILLQRGIDELNEEWKKPAQESYIFYATDLDSSYKLRNQVIKEAIQSITGIECKIGDEIRSNNVREAIARQISQATLVIADLTEDNINSYVEAGMAVGASRPLALIGKGSRHRPPFMLGNYQMYPYDSDLELLGIIHKIVFPFRRRIINSEVDSRNTR